MQLELTGSACGARITGVNLAAPLEPESIAAIRAAWLENLVLIFPEQNMDEEALERFAVAMGGLYRDPFLSPIPGSSHIAAIRREADELSPIFADTWHSDWSFEKSPPAGTALFAIDVPPSGGDTLFANQHSAWDELPAERKAQLIDKTAIHGARRGFANSGIYGGTDSGRTMDIRPDDSALATQNHPLVLQHPETGRQGIFSTWGYILGIEGMKPNAAAHFLLTLQSWQVQDRFVYRHRWEPGTLVLWDNRSTIHRATGGYDGHRRLLHRITIAPPLR
jgi:taurine dioxygenase